MKKKIVLKLIETIFTLLGVGLLLFVVLKIIPGSYVTTLMKEHINLTQIEKMEEELGLNNSITEQFINYFKNIIRGEFGTSFVYKKSVKSLIITTFPNTVKLGLMAILFAWVIGIPLGIFSSIKKNSILDKLISNFSLLGISVPIFVFAMILQYVFAFKLKLFPISSDSSSLIGFVLPAFALSWDLAGSLAMLIKSVYSDVEKEDYICFLEAKGGKDSNKTKIKHTLKNSFFPILSFMAMQLSSLFSGAVITESVFSVNGIGRLATKAISSRDIPLILGTVLFSTFIVVITNFLVECIYLLLDPRLRKKEILDRSIKNNEE